MSTATKKDLADDDFVPKNAETIVNPTIPGNYPYCRIRPFPTLGRNDYGPFNFVFLTVLIRGIPRVVANRGGWDPALLSAVSLLFDKMTSIIDDCRGRVNKILESGLLAVFPWGKDLSCVVPVVQPTFEEAIAAAQQAAWQIQRDYLLFVSNSKYNTDFLGGVSVVINFGEAYLSLLGNAAAYMDFTYIGTPITDMKDFGRSSKPGELWVLDVDGVSDDKFIGHEVS
ncbi:MAG TPA: hypothetical protein HPQ00_17645, partial [Magnetococcales bacterium]|nr:hypothetical protein [Magnetococcales bacterium]